MKDWRAAVRTWEKTQNNTTNGNKQQNGLDADAQWRAEMQASIARDYAEYTSSYKFTKAKTNF